MDTMTGQTTARESSGQEQEAVDGSTPDGKAESSAEREETQSQGTNDEVSSGKKGFKFERLKEDVCFQSNATDLEDPSVIIANPAYQEEIHKSKKKVKNQEQVDKLDLSSHDQKFTQGGGIINRMYREGADTSQQKDEEEKNQEVLDDVKTADDGKLENDERWGNVVSRVDSYTEWNSG